MGLLATAGLDESVARYLSQLNTADRHEPTVALAAKTERLKEKLAKLKEQMAKLAAIEAQMLAAPDQQVSLTDPDSRSMATSGRGSGVVGYNVQVAVDTEHHLIVTHLVTNSGSDRSQLANMARQTKAVLQAEELAAVADRRYFSGPQILECAEADITVTLPRPLTFGAKSQGRFGKQDFVYLPAERLESLLPQGYRHIGITWASMCCSSCPARCPRFRSGSACWLPSAAHRCCSTAPRRSLCWRISSSSRPSPTAMSRPAWPGSRPIMSRSPPASAPDRSICCAA
jgi:hypothetical protein